jgi:hypothetical protein
MLLLFYFFILNSVAYLCYTGVRLWMHFGGLMKGYEEEAPIQGTRGQCSAELEVSSATALDRPAGKCLLYACVCNIPLCFELTLPAVIIKPVMAQLKSA